MTNHWVDLKNSDAIFIIGANPAENHPASMLWVNRAMDDRGAKLIVVDPRFTRTAAKADIYAPLRSGTDIAFLGGLINYTLENNLHHADYVANYTNAAFLINADYKGPADLDGLFSGFNAEKKTYDRATWGYQTKTEKVTDPATGAETEKTTTLSDPTLKDPQTVFQILKRHYSRYDLDTVSRITGTPVDKLKEVYAAFAATGQPGKSGTILYAMGQTQHTVGSENVRIMAMLQLLLGNIGVPGGGVNALRGESNVQGSTDLAVLYHLLPGYLAAPSAAAHPDFKAYLENKTPKTSYWSNYPKFFVSLLKAWWGEAATADNDFAFDYLPKSAGDHSWIPLFEAMYAGTIKGLFVMGQNPYVCGPNARLERKGFENLDWMVVMELFDTETSSFWQAPGVKPADVKTEVFLLPAADAVEKAGSIVTSGRLIQWRNKVAATQGEAKEDIWIIDRMMKAIQAAYAGSAAVKDRPILDLTWDYGDPPEAGKVAREINGYYAATVTDDKGNLVAKKDDILSTFAKLTADGNTAAGCWIYTGYYAPADDGTGVSMPAAKRRGQKDPGGMGSYPYWGFAWPANRRIIYNRASADPDGNPWAEDKKLIWWDASADSGTKDAEGKPILGKWVGYDVPDFAPTKAPSAAGGKDPFIMRADGKGGLFGSLNEGPLPEHYEPLESPIANLLSKTQINPVVKVFNADAGKDIGDSVGTPDKYPIVCTTYRLTEHWQSGAMSRYLGWLSEAQPGMFVEISQELAAEKGIQNGGTVLVSSARGQIKATAMVTARWKPYTIDGKTVHQIGMPWHFSWRGIATGDSANDLTPHVGDGNTKIPEYKAFLVDLQKA